MNGLGSWLEGYDELAADVENSDHQTFQLNVDRWISYIDEHHLIYPYIQMWEQSANFDEWYSRNNSVEAQMNGGAALEWPPDATQRIGLQLTLFRKLGSGDIHFLEFARTFFWNPGNFDAHTRKLTQQLFRPIQRELRRKLQSIDLSSAPRPPEAVIPASDRIVRLDHNSDPYRDAIAALLGVRNAVDGWNEYDDTVDKEQQLAELDAGNALLGARQIRLGAAKEILLRCLKYLANKFADSVIGKIVEGAIVLLAALLGVHFLL